MHAPEVREGGGGARRLSVRRRGNQTQPRNPPERDALKPMQVYQSLFLSGQPVPAGHKGQVQGVAEAVPRALENPANGSRADAQEAGQFPLTRAANVDQAQEVAVPAGDQAEEALEVASLAAEATEFAFWQTREGEAFGGSGFFFGHVC